MEKKRPEDGKEFDDLEWEEISRKTLIHNEWIDFRQSAYRFPDGNVYEPYYSYSRRDYAVVVATDEEGRYICVRQFRQGIKEVTTEFPAGGIERKDGKEYAGRAIYGDDRGPDAAEEALEAAKRELLEETGYESDEWEHLLTIPSNATISDNYAYIYSAKNCRKVSGQELDVMEFLNVCLCSDDEIDELIHGGDFKQSVHVMAWLLAKRL
ncbi:MAG: NUDIX hydrolase [Eubacterium sp.]|nr:NUDIX hydrolase [Eubacterium sp.]